MFSLANREDFPILQTHNGQSLVYLDSAATSQKPQSVIQAEAEFYATSNANVHRGIYDLSIKATEAYEAARQTVAHFIGAQTEEIVFTRNATEGINLVAQTWGLANLQAGDEIWLSRMEHHSNLLPWQWLAEQTGAVVNYIDVDASGQLQFDGQRFSSKTKLVAVCQTSNVLGTVNDVASIIKVAHAVGAKVLVDAAQSIPHMPVSVAELDCDWLVFSGHKMLGPMGIGVLFGKAEVLKAMPPFLRGGEMIRQVSFEQVDWNEVPWKFEAGTPNVAAAVGLAVAIEYLQRLGMNKVEAHQRRLSELFFAKVSQIPELTIYGPKQLEQRSGLVSFSLEGVPAHDLASLLNEQQIAIRAGWQCAEPLHKHMGWPATARASWYVYNSEDDIEALVKGIVTAQKVFHP